MTTSTVLLQTIDLGHEQMLVINDRRGARVRVLYGGVWLTEEGEPGDHFVLAGEDARVGRDGATVIEALAPTRLELIAAPQPLAPAWLRRGWQSLRGALGLLSPAAT